MKRIALPLLLLLTAFYYASSQTISLSTAPNASVNYTRLKRIDTLINDYVQKCWISGIVTLIVKDNQIVQYKGYGYADMESKKPMEKDELFRIMSQTKLLTTVGIMMLFEQGKFLLDEPISHFIPEFSNSAVLDNFNSADSSYTTVPARRQITFHDLLTHSSGIDYPDIGGSKMKAIYAKADIPSGLGYFNANLLEKMKALAKLPLLHQPGERFTYGLNTDLLGCLIEVISGQSLETFLTEKICKPLGMKDTYFNVPLSKAGRLASVYTEDSHHQIIRWDTPYLGISADYPIIPKTYFSGGAGMTSTAYDYAVLLQMLLNKGRYNGMQLLSPRSVAMMSSEQLDFLINRTNTFGLGLEITSSKSARTDPRNEGSLGWGGYLGSVYWIDPKANLVGIYMIQQTPNAHADIEKKFEEAVYQSLK